MNHQQENSELKLSMTDLAEPTVNNNCSRKRQLMTSSPSNTFQRKKD